MRTSIVIAAAALSAAGVAAQDRKPDQAKKDDKPVLTVRGCIDGSWLVVRQSDPLGSYAERYRLIGSKQLLTEIHSNYNGHMVEITGPVTDTNKRTPRPGDNGSTTHLGKTIPVGKNSKITTGAKDVPRVPTADSPTLGVTSYVDLNPSCR